MTSVPANVAEQLGVDVRPRSRRRWVPAGVAAVSVAVLLLVHPWKRSAPIAYQTEPVRRGSLTLAVSATGILHPTNQIDVGSELSGIVRSVEATYNQRVRKGEVLARLDTTKLEAQAAQLRAALASAQAKVAQANATVEEDRVKLDRLHQVRERTGGKVPAQADIDAATAALARARADLAAAQASVMQSRATLQQTLVDMTKSTILSPVDGVVLTRSVEPGQTVAAALTAPVLFTVAEDLRRMELRVDVDEADVARVKPGQNAQFTVDAFANRGFRARVAQVRLGATTTSGVVTYTTVLAVDNEDLALFPGMTATAQILVERHDDALLVPSAALRFSPESEGTAPSGGFVGKLMPRPPAAAPSQHAEGSHVFVLRDGALNAVPVTVGASDGQHTEITADAVRESTLVVVGGGKQ